MICLVDVLGGHVVGVGSGGARASPVAASLHDGALNLVCQARQVRGHLKYDIFEKSFI